MGTLNTINFKGKQALIRVDFNVPLDERFKISDDTRMTAALPTINKVLNDGGSVVLMSHLGRPKANEEKFSLKPLINHLSELLQRTIHFADDCIGEQAFQLASQLKNGEVLLLNNLRYYSEEKAGDIEFAKKLSQLGNVYINDAFGTAHRAHASTSIIAQFFNPDNRFFGYLMEKEIQFANRLLQNPQKPFVAITGGAKVSDKIAILKNLIGKADHILIGGGMAYTFAKAQGGDIGNSLFEEDRVELALSILEQATKEGTQIHLPIDSKIADAFSADANTKQSLSSSIPDGWMGLDIGPKAIDEFTKVILSAKSILWNGPMGVFEMNPFAKGTKQIAQAVAIATKKGAFSLIGGGDSAAAVNQFGFSHEVSHISTGGGALLELFEGKELPGIKAVKG